MATQTATLERQNDDGKHAAKPHLSQCLATPLGTATNGNNPDSDRKLTEGNIHCDALTMATEDGTYSDGV